MIKLAACDPRLKAAVAQVPFINGLRSAKEALGNQFELILENFVERAIKEGADHLPVVSKDIMAAVPGESAYKWFTETADKMAPNWENRITIESLEKLIRYNPGSFAPEASTPILYIVADEDEYSPPDFAEKAYKRTPEPKEMLKLKMKHFDAYTIQFEDTAKAALKWFAEWLKLK